MNAKTTISCALVLVIFALIGLFAMKTPIKNGENSILGAVASPDIPSPYFSFGDVRQWAARDSDLTQATTTVCAIQSPAATSTLVAGGIQFTRSSTTASTITIAKASTAFATTTLINAGDVSANAHATILAASTTLSALEQTNRIFAPNQYLVFGVQGGIGTFSPAGSCHAVWVEN